VYASVNSMLSNSTAMMFHLVALHKPVQLLAVD
jgi:hypothetical protein